MKRGISNLVAIVIIIGIVIAIAIIILLWGQQLHQEIKQEVSQKAEKQLICSSDAKINIKEAKKDNGNIIFLVENLGKQNIKSLRLRLYEQNDIKTDKISIGDYTLEPYEIKKIEYTYPESTKAGNGIDYLKKVEIYPIITLQNEEVLCINSFAEKEITDKEITSCTGSSTQPCYIENGIGQQTRICNELTGIWSDWSTCQVISCNPSYTKQNNQCVPATCSAQNGDICLEEETCPGESLEATDTDYCCSEQCILPSWQQCSNCGQGLFNLCDREECELITQGCYFISGLTGSCYPCSTADCFSYNGDQVTCINDICSFDNCIWIVSKNLCEEIITSCSYCQHIEDNECVQNNYECSGTPPSQSCTTSDGKQGIQYRTCNNCDGTWTGTWTECLRDCSEYLCGELNDQGDCQPVSPGENGLPACQRCDGINLDPINIPTGQLDSEGDNLCDDSCEHCGNGHCCRRIWLSIGYCYSRTKVSGTAMTCTYSNLGETGYNPKNDPPPYRCGETYYSSYISPSPAGNYACEATCIEEC